MGFNQICYAWKLISKFYTKKRGRPTLSIKPKRRTPVAHVGRSVTAEKRSVQEGCLLASKRFVLEAGHEPLMLLLPHLRIRVQGIFQHPHPKSGSHIQNLIPQMVLHGPLLLHH